MTRPLLNFDPICETYNTTRFVAAPVLDAFSRMIVDRLPRGRESILLDLGVGTGLTAVPLRRAGLRVVGIDISKKMLLQAKARADSPGFLPLVQGNLQSCPFRNGSIDAALAYHVLHLVPNPAQALAEVRRVLRAEGKLYWLADVTWERSVADIVRQKYRELLGGRYNTNLPSARDFGLVHRHLGPTDAVRVLPLEAGTWTREINLSETLNWFENRRFGFQLNVPVAAHQEAMHALRVGCAERYAADYRETVDFFLEIREISFN